MEKKSGGVRYHVTDEQIREWEKVPVEERLRWLEEMNEFLYSVQDKETRACREEFRRGER
jgi:hypothetical protein